MTNPHEIIPCDLVDANQPCPRPAVWGTFFQATPLNGNEAGAAHLCSECLARTLLMPSSVTGLERDKIEFLPFLGDASAEQVNDYHKIRALAASNASSRQES